MLGPQSERDVNMCTLNKQPPVLDQSTQPLNKIVQKEIVHLKQIISYMAAQLDHYHMNKPVQVDARQCDLDLISGHVLAPVFREYEHTIDSQRQEIKLLRNQLKSCVQTQVEIQGENSKLIELLQFKTQENLQLVQNFPVQTENVENQRLQLLTEENHVLFEQITLLRAHTDHTINEYGLKTDEASQKIIQYDTIIKEFHSCEQDRINLQSLNVDLESKLKVQNQIIARLEETRKADQSELKQMRHQLTLFQQEYCFYKDLADNLEKKSFQHLDNSINQVIEREKDVNSKLNQAQKENLELNQLNRKLQLEIQTNQKDIRQVLKLNEEFQSQVQSMKDKELQYVELGREYRQKLEIVKFERERLALKEEQFIRLVHKAESEQKSEVNKAKLRYDQKLHLKSKNNEREVDELEAKLNNVQQDLEDKNEILTRLERSLLETRSQLDQSRKREDATVQEYTKVVQQLNSEIKVMEKTLKEKDTELVSRMDRASKRTEDAIKKFERNAQKLTMAK